MPAFALFPFDITQSYGMFSGRSRITDVSELEFEVNGHIFAEFDLKAVMLFIGSDCEFFIEVACVGGVLNGHDDIPRSC